MRGIDWTIPKRYLRLTLYDGRVVTTNKRVLSNLDDYFKITGDISATVSGASAEANFTLYGLKLDKMAFLSTSFSTWVVNQIRNEIVLDIGYENNHGIMFNGTITEALPSLDNENYSVKLKCMGSFAETLNSVVSLSFSGITPVSVIVARIASKLGYLPRISTSVKLMTVANYSLQNQPITNHLRYLAEIAGIDCYVENDTVVAKKSGEAVALSRTYKIDSSNMIGAPIPTNEGARVRVRLDPSIRTGQKVRLVSSKFPQLSGEVFIVQTIGTSFDTRGNDWKNELWLVKEGLYRQ